jgi:hypothetical protein
MRKVLFVNHIEFACGVQQFAKRIARIFQENSTKYEVYSLECSNINDFAGAVNQCKPEIIIYNYLPETMPWFNPGILNQLRNHGVKQGLIVHNMGYAHWFDFYLHQIPEYPENGNNYSILRPLFTYNKPPVDRNDGKIKIGSFGLGFKTKQWDKICELVNRQFDEEVDLHLHLTTSYFFPNTQELEEIKVACQNQITKPNIHLSFSGDFWDDNTLLDFLGDNDLNIYLYKYYDNYNGISGVTDYMMSVRKPIAICKTNMFSHINHVKPSICVEDNSLKQIIKNGFAPLQPYHDVWSHKKFAEHLDKILDKI